MQPAWSEPQPGLITSHQHFLPSSRSSKNCRIPFACCTSKQQTSSAWLHQVHPHPEPFPNRCQENSTRSNHPSNACHIPHMSEQCVHTFLIRLWQQTNQLSQRMAPHSTCLLYYTRADSTATSSSSASTTATKTFDQAPCPWS